MVEEHNIMSGGWVYILTNKPNGTLYVGVTADLARRMWEHRDGVVEGFAKKYGIKTLVYAEWHEEIGEAIHREKRIKHWPRDWKINLIVAENPHWEDITETML